jgi:DNA polymerase III alpha subunit
MQWPASSIIRLRDICFEQLTHRYPPPARTQARIRLERELYIAEQTDRLAEFSIAAEISQFAKTQNIACRVVGTGCSSAILYLLGFTGVDPARYNLLFECLCDREGQRRLELMFCVDPSYLDTTIELVARNHGCDVLRRGFIFSELTDNEMVPKLVADIVTSQGNAPCPNDIPDGDPEAYSLIRACDTEGIFELDAEEVGDLLTRLSPGSVEELAAITALAHFRRTGQEGRVEQYIEGLPLQRWESFPFAADIAEILKDSRGQILYDEQVMTLLHWCCGVSREDGYTFAKAGWEEERINWERVTFCWDAGLDEVTAETLFNKIMECVSSTFTVSKSHHLANAMLSYQAAFWKAHFPKEFGEVWQRMKG